MYEVKHYVNNNQALRMLYHR